LILPSHGNTLKQSCWRFLQPLLAAGIHKLRVAQDTLEWVSLVHHKLLVAVGIVGYSGEADPGVTAPDPPRRPPRGYRATKVRYDCRTDAAAKELFFISVL
jgi:hypothetical protein